MACNRIIGIRNIKVSFEECGTGRTVTNVIHKLGTEELPTHDFTDYELEDAGDGFTRRKQGSFKSNIVLKRNPRIPTAWYQGGANLIIVLEYEDDSVVVGRNGTPTGETMSDRINVEINAVWEQLSEILPTGALAAA